MKSRSKSRTRQLLSAKEVVHHYRKKGACPIKQVLIRDRNDKYQCGTVIMKLKDGRILKITTQLSNPIKGIPYVHKKHKTKRRITKHKTKRRITKCRSISRTIKYKSRSKSKSKSRSRSKSKNKNRSKSRTIKYKRISKTPRQTKRKYRHVVIKRGSKDLRKCSKKLYRCNKNLEVANKKIEKLENEIKLIKKDIMKTKDGRRYLKITIKNKMRDRDKLGKRYRQLATKERQLEGQRSYVSKQIKTYEIPPPPPQPMTYTTYQQPMQQTISYDKYNNLLRNYNEISQQIDGIKSDREMIRNQLNTLQIENDKCKKDLLYYKGRETELSSQYNVLNDQLRNVRESSRYSCEDIKQELATIKNNYNICTNDLVSVRKSLELAGSRTSSERELYQEIQNIVSRYSQRYPTSSVPITTYQTESSYSGVRY
jgi:predicted  nucleic acid-binding Zn-ribbon protein